ncbi:hypothetical protein TNCV_2390151 [Trichonephila clavipes]|nr:hypothetical protein TNCV_2390151 [Trichonephila clavipes]
MTLSLNRFNVHHPSIYGGSSVAPGLEPATRKESTLGWSETSRLSSPSTNLTRELAARRLFRVPPCHTGTIHLQTSMSSPGSEPSPYGTTSLVYADKPQTLDHLEDNIRRVIADIRPQMLEKVIENWTSRLDYIRASRGSPMPEIIFKM